MIVRRLIAAVFLLLMITANSMASTMPVPVHVQLPLFVKIWKLDRAFPERNEVVVAIIYQESHTPSASVKAQVMAWVSSIGQRIRCVPVAVDNAAFTDNKLESIAADVFYVAPLRGADIEGIARIARMRKIKTITGVPDYVPLGLSVAIDVRNDRPLIVINVPASRAEGSSFPAQLLQLARVVGR